MTVPTRLIAGFVALVLILVLPTAYATMRLGELQRLAVGERGQHATASSAIGRMEASLVRLDLDLRSYLADPSPGRAGDVQTTLDDLRREVARLDDAGFAESAGAVAPTVEALDATVEQLEALAEEGRLAEATTAFRGTGPLVEAAEEGLARAARTVDLQAQRDFARAEQISTSASAGTLLALLLSLALAGIIGVWGTGALASPLRRLSRATAEVADGQLDAPDDLPYERSDEIGELSRSFRHMTNRLAELDRLKAEFVGVASHELKTPINVIRGYTELIEEELSGEVTEHQREILHDIAAQCRTMSRMVSRLMDISRLETGAYRLEMEEIHLEDLLTGLVRAFELVADQEGVELRTEIEDGAPATLDADMDIVRDEILGNLVSNALKFTPEGGEVRVSARDADGWVAIRVADTGPGIPAEHREHIFDKYHQVDRSRKVGSGLGLAIAREMAEAHDGTVELHRSDDSGSVFEVRLPVERSAGPDGRRAGDPDAAQNTSHDAGPDTGRDRPDAGPEPPERELAPVD